MSSARPAALASPTATGLDASSDGDDQVSIVYASPKAPFSDLPRGHGWLKLAREHPVGAQDPCEHGRLADSCEICIFGGPVSDEEVVPATPSPKKRRFEYPGAAPPARACRMRLAREAAEASPTVIVASPAKQEPTLYEIALEERVKKLQKKLNAAHRDLQASENLRRSWKRATRKADDNAFLAHQRIDLMHAELAKVNVQYDKLADATAELIRSLTTKLRSDGECHRTLQSTIEKIYEHHM